MEGVVPVVTSAAAPVDSTVAFATVARTLPGLGAPAQRAVALVDLGGSTRAEAVAELGVPADELARLLAAGRKALRRTLGALPSAGWCERAELLISERIDGAISATGERRLDAHLGGCERCATHDRRLAEARDLLLLDASVDLAEETEPAERRLDLRGWHLAFVVGVLLVVAAVALGILAITGAVHVP
jgi:putative zinc finger protein